MTGHLAVMAYPLLIARIAGALLVSTCLALAFATYALLLRRNRHASAFGRFGLRALRRLFGMRIATVGKPLRLSPGGHLVVVNHRTGLDVIALDALLDLRVLAHAGVGRWPLVGRMARAAGTIFVDRGAGGSRAAALRSIAAALTAGQAVLVFPEGTTYAGDEVRRFSSGVFAAARGHFVLPVGMAVTPGAEFTEDSFAAHLWRLLRERTTVFTFAIGEPYECPEIPEDAAPDARQRVEALVHQARRAFEDPREA